MRPHLREPLESGWTIAEELGTEADAGFAKRSVWIRRPAGAVDVDDVIVLTRLARQGIQVGEFFGPLYVEDVALSTEPGTGWWRAGLRGELIDRVHWSIDHGVVRLAWQCGCLASIKPERGRERCVDAVATCARHADAVAWRMALPGAAQAASFS